MAVTARSPISLIPTPVRQSGKALFIASRVATWSFRMLPTFVVIGSQRGGTTSLYEYLIQHPLISRARHKEVHFFDIAYRYGESWYRAQFPLKAWRYLPGKRGLITGEASPYYLLHPLAPERAAKLIPNARLIALLRDPVDRAISEYHHEKRHGWETLPIEEAFDAEQSRIGGELEKIQADPLYHSLELQHHSYVTRGQYVEQLERWFKHFPREQVLIMSSEFFYGHPAAAMQRIYEHIGLPPHTLPRYEPFNQGSYNPADEAIRQRLTEHYAPYNERLFELLGERFDWPAQVEAR